MYGCAIRGGMHRQTSTPHTPENKMKRKKKDVNFYPYIASINIAFSHHTILSVDIQVPHTMFKSLANNHYCQSVSLIIIDDSSFLKETVNRLVINQGTSCNLACIAFAMEEKISY